MTFDIWITTPDGVEHETLELANYSSSGIESMAINASGHLIITYSDGSTQDAGAIPNAVHVTGVTINANGHLIFAYDDGSTFDAGELPTDEPDYPEYAKTEMETVAEALNGYMSTLDNPIVIGFNTDQHVAADSDGGTYALIRKDVTYGLKTLRDLTKKLPFDFVVLGGDTHGGAFNTVASMQDSAIYVKNQMDGIDCPLAMLVGNHEGGQDDNTITRGQVYRSHVTNSMLNKAIVSVDHTSGYYDDPVHKVRFVFLDSYPRQEVNYLTTHVNRVLNTMLSSVPEGYKALIFSHHPLDENLPQVAERKGWNNPIWCHSTLQSHKDKIIACICGHVHNNLVVEDQDGITFISTTCAGQYELNDGSTRVKGTVDATAYDIFVIDQANETIYAIRYGNGNSRTISYAHETPPPAPTILLDITGASSVGPYNGYSQKATVTTVENGFDCSITNGGGGAMVVSSSRETWAGFTNGKHAAWKCDSYECDISGSFLPGYVNLQFFKEGTSLGYQTALGQSASNILEALAAMTTANGIVVPHAGYWGEADEIRMELRTSTNGGAAISPAFTLNVRNLRLELVD